MAGAWKCCDCGETESLSGDLFAIDGIQRLIRDHRKRVDDVNPAVQGACATIQTAAHHVPGCRSTDQHKPRKERVPRDRFGCPKVGAIIHEDEMRNHSLQFHDQKCRDSKEASAHVRRTRRTHAHGACFVRVTQGLKRANSERRWTCVPASGRPM